MTLRILFICTGNVCRSPTAELLLRSWAAPGAGLAVRSAGVAALEGHPMDDSSATVLRRRGLDPDRHRGQQFRSPMATSADLVLTADSGQRDIIMTEAPAAFRRTFTLKEFARVAHFAGDPHDSDARRTVSLVADARGPAAEFSDVRTDGPDDVADPFGASVAIAGLVADQIATAVRQMMTVLDIPRLRPQPRPRPRPHRR